MMRPALMSASPPGRMASASAAAPAARTARQSSPQRAVMPAKARPLLAAVVFWDRIVDTTAAGGGASTSRRAGDGRPYMRMRPAVTRSAAAGVGR